MTLSNLEIGGKSEGKYDMKKYRIVVRTADLKRQVDFLDFNSYKKFNQRYDELFNDVKNLRSNIVRIERYIGSEMIECCVAVR